MTCCTTTEVIPFVPVCTNMLETAVMLLYLQLYLVAQYTDIPIIYQPISSAVSSSTASAPAAIMIHSEKRFPLVEPRGFGGWDDDSSSFCLSVCHNDAIRVAARGLTCWSQMTLLYPVEMCILLSLFWPSEPSALMTCSNSTQQLLQLEPACVRVLIQNCSTSNMLSPLKVLHLSHWRTIRHVSLELFSLVWRESYRVSEENH